MVPNIKGNLKKINLMEKEYLFKKTEQNMWEILKTILSVDKG